MTTAPSGAGEEPQIIKDVRAAAAFLRRHGVLTKDGLITPEEAERRGILRPSGAGEAGPVAYLVAERRQGQWLLSGEWPAHYESLAEAQGVADHWRTFGGDPADVGVFAVCQVQEVSR